MANKFLGVILILIGAYILKIGFRYNDSDSYYLMNVKLIGSSILLFIGGIALICS